MSKALSLGKFYSEIQISNKIDTWAKKKKGAQGAGAVSCHGLVQVTHTQVLPKIPLNSTFEMGPPSCVYIVCDQEVKNKQKVSAKANCQKSSCGHLHWKRKYLSYSCSVLPPRASGSPRSHGTCQTVFKKSSIAFITHHQQPCDVSLHHTDY